MTRKSAFKHILQRYTRISFGSGGVWRWLCAFVAVPVCFWVIPGRLCCRFPVWLWLAKIAPGGGAFVGSRWRSAADRLAVSGAALGWRKNTKEVYDKSETASKSVRFELGNLKKSQKSETNSDLRLFIFCAFCI